MTSWCNMIRTQVQLTERQIGALKRLAAQEKKSVADLVRQSVEIFLARQTEAGKALRIQRALAASGKFASKTTDVSTNHDRYLVDAYLE